MILKILFVWLGACFLAAICIFFGILIGRGQMERKILAWIGFHADGSEIEQGDFEEAVCEMARGKR